MARRKPEGSNMEKTDTLRNLAEDEHWMHEAIRVAHETEREGGAPVGVVLVKDGVVVAEGHSLPWKNFDPTLHGEMDCIRTYAKEARTMDLSGCTLYTTLESCGMCFSASLWAGIDQIVFGAYASDIPKNSYEYVNYSSAALAQKSYKWATPERGPIAATGDVLRKECIRLFDGYKNWQREVI